MPTLPDTPTSEWAVLNAVVWDGSLRVFSALLYPLLDVSHVQRTPGLPIMYDHVLCTCFKRWLCHRGGLLFAGLGETS